MIKKLLFLLLVNTVVLCLFADDISISATVDRNIISLDEQISLRVEISGSGGNIPSPQLPDLSDFTVYSSGRSQNISIVNGQMSSSLSFNYVLVPRHTGKFIIGPVVLNYAGKTYSTQPINVEVTPAGQKPRTAVSQSAPSGQVGKGMFVESFLDKNTAYVNEQVIYTVRFYRRIRLLSNPQYVPADFSGFWAEDLPPPRNYQTVVNGQRYLVTEIKTALFPTAPGTFSIAGGRIICQVEDFSPDDFWSDDFFKQFFSGGKQQQLNIPAVTLRVLPLPQEKPVGFNGAVGHYQITARTDKTKVKTGEALNFIVSISGEGNIKTIAPPVLNLSDDFRKFETVSSDTISKEKGKISGTKTFQTVLIPQTPGEKIIPPVVFAFFDPDQKQYVQLKTDVIRLSVSGNPIVQQKSLSVSRPEIITDIRYLKEVKNYSSVFPQYYKSIWIFLIEILFALLVVGAFFYGRWQQKILTNPKLWRSLRAYSQVQKTVSSGKKLLNTGKIYDAGLLFSRAIDEYLAAKFSISAEGLTNKIVETILKEKGTPKEVIDKVVALRDFYALVRFAPTALSAQEVKEKTEQLEEILKILQKVLK